MLATTVVATTWFVLVGLLMLPTCATGACSFATAQDVGGLGSGSRAILLPEECPRGQRIEYLEVHHGFWVEGLIFTCSDGYTSPLIGEKNDFKTSCQDDVVDITAVFCKDQPVYLADMVVTCRNGDENTDGYGNNYDR